MIYLDPTHILMNLLSSKKFKDTETISSIQNAIHSIEQLKLNNINSFNYVIMQISRLKSELEELNNRSCESCKYSFDIFTGIDDSLLGEDFICTKLEVDKVFEKDFYCSKYEPKQ